MVFSAVCLLPCLGASSGEASAVISNADGSINACYKALADAQRAGANVSYLVDVLNEAGWLLSRAKLAYVEGDFDSAVAHANGCLSKLNGFLETAENLRAAAERASSEDFMFNFVGSAVGAACIVVGGLAVWLVLNRREKSGERS